MDTTIKKIIDFTHIKAIKDKDALSSSMDDNALDKIFNIFLKNDSLADIFREINRYPEYKKIDSGLYSTEDAFIQIGSVFNMSNTVENLFQIKEYDLSFAPKIIDAATGKGGRYQIVATKMQPTVPYGQNKDKVSFEQKMKFLAEIMKLGNEANLYNPCILNENKWYTTKDGRIFINDWSELNSFNNDSARQKYYNAMAKKLGIVFY